ncbi:MAG: hypothetical protein ABI614_13065 [Planctomycetota bacterium]
MSNKDRSEGTREQRRSDTPRPAKGDEPRVVNTQRPPNSDELCVVNWALSHEIRLPEAIATPGGSKVKCLNVTVNVYFRVTDDEPRVTRLTLGESNIAGLVSFTVAASRTGEGWTADAYLKRHLERSILPTISEDILKQDDNLVRAMWGKYRSSLPDEPAPNPEAPSFEPPTPKQLAFAKKLRIEVDPSMSKVDVASAIEDAVERNPTLKKKLDERDAKREQEAEEVARLQHIKECGPELIAAESEWQKFIDEIGFMLAVYQRGKKTIVDVLEVYDVSIEGKKKKKLKLYVAAPTAEKFRVKGILWDEEHVLSLFWNREFGLSLEKLLYHEPLRAKFDECFPSVYARTVKRGLEIAKRL